MQIRYPFDDERLRRMSLIEEGPEKKVRMAHLAVVGSHSVNGVAELHTELLKRDVLPDFAEMFPERFNNKTNGVTPRRWLLQCNPRLSALITARIGDGWVTRSRPAPAARAARGRRGFLARLPRGEATEQERLADHVRDTLWLNLDPTAIFDVQIKRLHEYKRQLLNALHIVALWMRARENPAAVVHPRVFLFGAKAAPGYVLAKLIIRLINGIAEVVNGDRGRTGSRWSSCPTTACRWPSGSSPRPTSPSRSPPRARRPPAPGT